MILFYGYKNCDSSRKAEKVLQQAHLDYQFIDITQHPPTLAQLETWFVSAGLALKNWFNVTGQLYRELNLKQSLELLSTIEALQLLANHGKLIKRPLVVHEQRISIGFKPDLFTTLWCT